jgi:hypothetical protein
VSDAGAGNDLGDVRAGALAAASPGGTAGLGLDRGPRVDAGRDRRSVLPTVGAGILALLFLAAAWFAAGRGIITDTWPAFLADTDSTSITRYSGPWLTAAAAAALGAGLCVMGLVRRLTSR